MTKLEKIKQKFYFDEKEMPKLLNYGKYRNGLTSEEIDDYLRMRANTVSIKKIRKKFYKIAGVNTVSSCICKECGHMEILLYRHDVLRFADQLFLGTKTYWD